GAADRHQLPFLARVRGRGARVVRACRRWAGRGRRTANPLCGGKTERSLRRPTVSRGGRRSRPAVGPALPSRGAGRRGGAAPGDIAGLLPGHANVLELRALLQQRRVPCVGAGNSSVFDTDWARELQVVLYAIEHPADAGAVGAALATRLGGLDFERLRELRDA